jgi:cytoskeletal protein CcmA (bactofilin family)
MKSQESELSYFSASKADRETKLDTKANTKTKFADTPARIDATRLSAKADEVSTIAAGMQVIGNIVCSGALQIFGTVTGDIHAAQLSIREGARVEGKVIAPDAAIEGAFIGTIHGNAVKLQKTAVVEGEIFNKSLSIEEAARFEGVSRRLERAVEAPSMNSGARSAAPLELVNGQAAAPTAHVTAPRTAPVQ